jgi:AraC-like DNA-binding protein
LTLEGDDVRLHHHAPGRPCAGRIHEDVFVVLVTIRMLRQFAGRDWSPGEVSLMTPDARMLGDLEVFGGADIRFGATHSSFTLPFELLRSPIPESARGASAASGEPPVVEPVMPHGFLEGVEALVTSMLSAGSLSMNMVAEAAGVSARTLQRQLRDLGCSYSDLVQRSRMRQAREWLASTDMPVHEVAFALGYLDPANFTRAFRRVMGMPPREYRRPH